MSAFDRLPKTYLDLCRQIAKAWTRRDQPFPLSPRNRRVRFAADMHEARRRMDAEPERYPNRMTRQQKRWLHRRDLLAPDAPS